MAQKIVIDIDILESILKQAAHAPEYYYAGDHHAYIPEMTDQNKEYYHSMIGTSIDNALKSALSSVDRKIAQTKSKLIYDFIEAIKASSSDYHGCQLCVPFNTVQN